MGGRIRKQDVLAAAEKAASRKQEQDKRSRRRPPQTGASPTASSPAARRPQPTPAKGAPEPGSRVKLPRLRQVIAQRMTESLRVSAQLTTVQEVDVTRIARLRAQAKAEFERREGVKLTYLPFFAKAALEALRQYPQLNASIDEESKEVTYHGAVHLAIAVDTPRGLLVPVISNADELNIAGLARHIADLAARTRDNKVGPNELSGGTFTITNIGSSGALFDTPIINQPQVAILGTGAISKEPKVVTGPGRRRRHLDPVGLLPAADLRPPARRRRGRRPLRHRDPRAPGGGRVRGGPGAVGRASTRARAPEPKGSPRARRRGRIVRLDRNRPRRPSAGRGARGAAPGPPGARGTRRARLGPAGGAGRPGHVRRRRRGGEPWRPRGRGPALERGAPAGLRDSRACPRTSSPAPSPSTGYRLISQSAIGYYGDGGGVASTSRTLGPGFLADVIRDWEAADAARPRRAAPASSRCAPAWCSPRPAGCSAPLKLLFGFALGGRLGPGTQYMPWISLDDEVGAIGFLLENGSVDGPVNIVGPTPATNAEFMPALAKALHRPAPFAVPAAVIRTPGRVDGRGDAAVRTAGGPGELETVGYRFRYRTLDEALAAAWTDP